MKNIIKDTLILFAITLVAGLGLGLVYNVTANSSRLTKMKQKKQLNLTMPQLMKLLRLKTKVVMI